MASWLRLADEESGLDSCRLPGSYLRLIPTAHKLHVC